MHTSLNKTSFSIFVCCASLPAIALLWGTGISRGGKASGWGWGWCWGWGCGWGSGWGSAGSTIGPKLFF